MRVAGQRSSRQADRLSGCVRSMLPIPGAHPHSTAGGYVDFMLEYGVDRTRDSAQSHSMPANSLTSLLDHAVGRELLDQESPPIDVFCAAVGNYGVSDGGLGAPHDGRGEDCAQRERGGTPASSRRFALSVRSAQSSSRHR